MPRPLPLAARPQPPPRLRHADAKFHTGIEMAELGDHRRAIRVFDEILAGRGGAGAGGASVAYAKSRSLAAEGEGAAAMALLGEAISKDPKTIRAWAREEKIFERYHSSEQFRKMVKM